jgi:hypothetical protein
MTKELFRKIEEENLYLMGPPNPSLDEHIAQVRLAKELMARRKAKEVDANRRPGDPAPEPPEINLGETSFEELFPTDESLNELAPEDSDRDEYQRQVNADIPVEDVERKQPKLGLPTPPHDATDRSAPSDPLSSIGGEGRGEEAQSSAALDRMTPSDSVKPSQTESNQIQPPPPRPRTQLKQ